MSDNLTAVVIAAVLAVAYAFGRTCGVIAAIARETPRPATPCRCGGR